MTDIAHALGSARGGDGEPSDPLGVALALAIACRRESDWPRIHGLAHARALALLQEAQRTRERFVSPNTFRASLVLHYAFVDLVAGRTMEPIGARARVARLRCGEYAFAHRLVASWMEALAATAAADAVRALFGS